MFIELKFAELHNPLFLNGTNLQMKLNPTHRTELQLFYYEESEKLIVLFGKELSIVPTSNVASMNPIDPMPILLKLLKDPNVILRHPELQALKALGDKADTIRQELHAKIKAPPIITHTLQPIQTDRKTEEKNTKETEERVKNLRKSAQVSTPTGHVFETGAGKVRD